MLFGHTVLPFGVWALAPAMVASSRQLYGDEALWVSLFSLAGLALGHPAMLFWALPELVVLLAVMAFFQQHDASNPTVSALGTAMVALPFGVLSIGLGHGLSPAGWLTASLGASISGLTQLALMWAWPKAQDRLDAARRTRALGFLALLVIFALARIHAAPGLPVAWWLLAAGLCTLWAARGSGYALGAAMGVAGAASALVGGSGALSMLGELGLAGLVAGALRPLGGFAVGLGFLAGALVFRSTAQPLALAQHALLLFGATLLFWVMPFDRVVRFLVPERAPGAERSDPAGRRVERFGQVFLDLARAFDQAAAGSERSPDQVLGRHLERLTERVCAGCPHFQTCWQSDFYRTYRGVLDVLAQPVRSKVMRDMLPAELLRRCPRPGEVTLALSYLRDVSQSEQVWNRRLAETREVIAGQLRGTARTLFGLAEDLRRPEMQPHRSTFRLETGVAKVPKTGGTVSGDSHLVQELSDGRVLLALADGMGAGPRAALESSATVRLVQRLIDAGLDEVQAVRSVNAVLLLKSPEENFSTLDLVLVELAKGQASLLKVGAAPSFFYHDGQIERIEAHSLPLGIVGDVEGEFHQRALHPGDMILIMSDGMLEALAPQSGVEAWLQGFLSNLDSQETMEEITERLLRQSLRRVDNRPQDDLTILALRVALEEEVPETSAWVRLQV